jgi:DNA-binding XRE family transcriptional regulator
MDLKQARKSLGLTLAAAGDLIGASREAVRLAEAGKAPDAAGKLAQRYKAEAKHAVKAAFKQKGGTHTMKITFDITLDDNGDITIKYEGYHPNTDYVADLIVKAIAAAEDRTISIPSKK